jgi:hypothetical protein
MMPLLNRYPQRREPLRGRTLMQIAAAHFEAQPLTQLRDTAHAGATHTYKVQSPLPRQQSCGHSAHAA